MGDVEAETLVLREDIEESDEELWKADDGPDRGRERGCDCGYEGRCSARRADRLVTRGSM